jgi:catechol 2,3-dioxygenase-like lactoylglutathione lyase family enzyme
MIQGGVVTIYVSDMQRAVDFYADVLGLRLLSRADGHWAQLTAGGLQIGLHPASVSGPAPGTPGATTLGLVAGVPIAEAVAALESKDVAVRGPVSGGGGIMLAFFTDPDGNPLYLAEAPDRRPTG